MLRPGTEIAARKSCRWLSPGPVWSKATLFWLLRKWLSRQISLSFARRYATGIFLHRILSLLTLTARLAISWLALFPHGPKARLCYPHLAGQVNTSGRV